MDEIEKRYLKQEKLDDSNLIYKKEVIVISENIN